MASLRQLPVLQNWDCHAHGTCCKEYRVAVTEEERQRIEAQGWDKEPDFAGTPLFTRHGPLWARSHQLNHRDDGSCVFLSAEGRCRIHERFGPAAKPLPCRLFPFVLIPAGDHWRIGLRFACPSAAANLGRPASAHNEDLDQFADQLARREGLESGPRGPGNAPPRLTARRQVEWPDLFRFVQTLQSLLQDRRDPLERRLRKCLTLARLCREARFDQVKAGRLAEFLKLITASLDDQVPADASAVLPPSWIGRVLFRQAVALFARKDHGPNRGLASRGRLALLRAAWHFARGTGPLPRLHAWLPETTFEQMEAPAGPLPAEAEQVLERYYVIKVTSLQFCGPAYNGLPFWEGLEALAVTFPIILFLARAYRNQPGSPDNGTCSAGVTGPAGAVTRVLSIVDDHFGFNRVLGTTRQRFSFSILARMEELDRLIAWYSR